MQMHFICNLRMKYRAFL